MSTLDTIKKRIMPVFMALLIAIAALAAPRSAAAANEWSLYNDTTYKSLVASVIFSRGGSSNNASSMTLPLSVMACYPSPNDKYAIYGQLTDPKDDNTQPTQTTAGSAAANYVQALYNYNWLVPLDNSSFGTKAKNFESKIISAMTLGLVKSASVTQNLTTLGSKGAAFGASIYDAMTGLANALGRVAMNINIPSILGFAGNQAYESQIQKNTLVSPTTASVQAVPSQTSNNSLVALLQNFLLAAGISSVVLINVRRIVAAMIILIFILAVLRVIFSARRRASSAAAQNARGWGMRLVTIFCAIPLAIFLTDLVTSTVTDLQKANTTVTQTVSDGYIVDTLRWAVGTNLNFGSQSPDTHWGATAADAPYPSAVNVQRINVMAENACSNAGVTLGATPATATGIIDQFNSGEQATVSDYLAALESAKNIGALGAGTNLPHVNDTVHYVDSNGDPNQVKLGNNFVFLSTYKNGKSAAQQGSGKTPMMTAVTPLTYSLKDGVALVFDSNSLMSVANAAPENPQNYIFGGTAPDQASDQSVVIDDFINGKDTSQADDPATGDVADNTTASTSGGFTDQSYRKSPLPTMPKGVNGAAVVSFPPPTGDVEGAMGTNALAIAAENKLAGTGPGSGLSTQSVAFLLQSTLSGDLLYYKGYNTIASPAGQSKNTGVNGITFARYVIPSSSEGDLLLKIGSLSVIWITAGIASVIAILALIRAPIIKAIIKSFGGLLKAVFTGNFLGLGTYVIYYLALNASFAFASMAVLSGVWVAQFFLNVAGGLLSVPGVPILAGISGFLSGPGIMWMCAIIVAVMCMPLVNMNIGRKKDKEGKPRKCSIISAVVYVPYMLAESGEAALQGIYERAYPRSNFKTIMTQNVGRNDLKADLKQKKEKTKKVVEKTGKVAVTAGAAVATGGAALGASAAAAGGSAAAGGAASGAGAAAATKGAGVKAFAGAIKDDVLLKAGQGRTDTFGKAVNELTNKARSKYSKSADAARKIDEKNPELSKLDVNKRWAQRREEARAAIDRGVGPGGVDMSDLSAEDRAAAIASSAVKSANADLKAAKKRLGEEEPKPESQSSEERAAGAGSGPVAAADKMTVHELAADKLAVSGEIETGAKTSEQPAVLGSSVIPAHVDVSPSSVDRIGRAVERGAADAEVNIEQHVTETAAATTAGSTESASAIDRLTQATENLAGKQGEAAKVEVEQKAAESASAPTTPAGSSSDAVDRLTRATDRLTDKRTDDDRSGENQ